MSDHDPSDEPKRRRMEGMVGEFLKRAVERGVERASEAPDSLKSFVSEMRLPKEIAGYVFSQIDETKNGLFRVVAKEIRDFLEQTNIAGDIQKVLTTVQFEVHTTIRFSPNDGSKRRDKDKDKDKERDRASAVPSRSSAPPPAAAQDGDGADGDEIELGEASAEGLPRPELKTDVFVNRERQGRRRRSNERE